MIDMLALRIPFKDDYVDKRLDGNSLFAMIDIRRIAELSGLMLSAYTVEFAIDGDLTVSGLKHNYESLPTHYAGIACKVYEGGKNFYPCVEIKASPAKVLQGHNVFGPVDLELCSSELLCGLATSMPQLYELLDVPGTVVARIDATYSAKVSNDSIAKQVISFLKNVSNGQTKRTRAQEFETTVMWNETSRTRVLVAYLKYPELMGQLEKLRSTPSAKLTPSQLNSLRVMSDPELHEFACGLVRFEARLKPRFLTAFGFPSLLVDAINFQRNYKSESGCVVFDLWQKAFGELFASFEGSDMNVYNDDKVFEELKKSYFSYTPKGNISYASAHRLFGFYRRLLNEGYDDVQNTMSKSTFYRQISQLVNIGLSKSQLQNLSSTRDNVVPLMRVINIDFLNQKPSWYSEPVSRYA